MFIQEFRVLLTIMAKMMNMLYKFSVILLPPLNIGKKIDLQVQVPEEPIYDSEIIWNSSHNFRETYDVREVMHA